MLSKPFFRLVIIIIAIYTPYVMSNDLAEINSENLIEKPQLSIEDKELKQAIELFSQQHYSDAFPYFEKWANAENHKAMFYLALSYEQGQGVTTSEKLAKYWYLKSAQSGSFQENFSLILTSFKKRLNDTLEDPCGKFLWIDNSEIYNTHGQLSERSKIPNIPRAIKLYEIASECGNYDAMTRLASIYYTGSAGQVDLNKAFELYSIAAEKGQIIAQHTLGNMYEFGNGTKLDFKMAAKWYAIAAKKGAPIAQNALGVLYAKGKGVEQDQNKAFYWYQQSASDGFSEGQFNLGYRYETGQGVEKSYTMARQWYAKSANQGHEKASFNLAMHSLNEKYGAVDYDLALTLFNQSLLSENIKLRASSEYEIGNIYHYGMGVRRDLDEAKKWYEKAIFNGNKLAFDELLVVERKIAQTHSALAEETFDEGFKALKKGNYPRAETFFKDSIKYNWLHANSYSLLGQALALQNKFDESIKAYKDAIRLAPNNVEIHGNFGFTYSLMNDWENAIKHYQIALKIDPKHQSTIINLRQASAHLNKN